MRHVQFQTFTALLSAALAWGPAKAEAQDRGTREPGEFVCVVGLVNEYAGEASCFDGWDVPSRQYDVMLFRIGADYLGRLACNELVCSSPEAVRLDYRPGQIPLIGEFFDCLTLEAGTWQCAARVSQ